MATRPILTVTLNPALDLMTATAQVSPGQKLRCDDAVSNPGGGGLNVSRAIANLGGASHALVALGGATGDRMAGLIAKTGQSFDRLEAPGETRTSFAVGDRTSGHQYRFIMPGPAWSDQQAGEALARCIGAAQPDSLVVLSGSFPPGVGATFIQSLALALAPMKSKLLIDTSGPVLAALAKGSPQDARPALIRISDTEAAEIAGHRMSNVNKAATLASDLHSVRVAEAVIISVGSDGSVLATSDGVQFCRAARVPLVSKLGAGDSFMAGATLALANGSDWISALDAGTAAACAAVMAPGTELCAKAETDRLRPLCETRTVFAARGAA
ncbi:MAG: hexose kinase [Pseudomonadota bacterium]